MKVEKIKELLELMGRLEMDRTEFTYELTDYLKGYDGSIESLEQWLVNVYYTMEKAQKLTGSLLGAISEDKRNGGK